jgi:tol-pal system protein YbgF
MSRLLLLHLIATLAVVAPTTQAKAEITTDLATLQREQVELAREVGTLRDHLVLLEARLLDQQKQLGEMREGRALPSPQGPGDEYLRAFGDYAAGRYPQAIAKFEAFIRNNPTDEYAGNAQFWLGDCYFEQKQYAVAVAEWRKVVSSYPDTGKAPDSLAKIATALRLLKFDDQAREALDALRTRYPNSAAARQVRPRN